MSRVEAVISDFGGVLTSPLIESYAAVQDASGVPLEALGKAMAAIAERNGSNPLFELETGRLSESQFLDGLSRELTEQLGRTVSMQDFGRSFFQNLRPNERMIDYLRGLRDQGYKLGICTNNVREWEPLWRAKLPVDELFPVVVDSAFVGARKPDRRIYEITLERLAVPAEAALMIDDVEVNCTAARELGMRAVWFRDTDEAIGEIEEQLR